MSNPLYWRLSSFYFSYYAILGAFSPYFSLFLESRGVNDWWISIIMAFWFLTRVFVPTAWAAASERSSRPILWLRYGTLIAGMSIAWFLLPLNLSGMLLAVLVFSMMMNGVMPQFEALTLSHLGKQTQHYGRIRLWGSMGFLVVVAGFGWVFEYISYQYLVWLMLPLFVATVISASCNDFPAAYQTQARPQWQSVVSILRRTDVRAFFICCLLMQLSFGPFYVYYSLYLKQHGYSPLQIGNLWALGVVAEVFIMFSARRWLLRLSAARVFQLVFAAGILRWLITAVYPENLLMMVLAQLLHAVNFGAFFVAVIVLIQRFFPGRLAVHGQGILWGFSSGIGGVIGALLAGLIWKNHGSNFTFIMAAIVSMAGLLIAVRYIQPRPAATQA